MTLEILTFWGLVAAVIWLAAGWMLTAKRLKHELKYQRQVAGRWYARYKKLKRSIKDGTWWKH